MAERLAYNRACGFIALLIALSTQTYAQPAEPNTCTQPHILIYSDASGSMKQRWEILQRAVQEFATKAEQVQARLEFKFFLSKGNSCDLDVEREDISLAEARSFTQNKTVKPKGAFTPLAKTLLRGLELLRKTSPSSCSKKVLVVITDGMPDCPGGKTQAAQDTLAALNKAAPDVQILLVGAGDPQDLRRLVGQTCTEASTPENLSLDKLSGCTYIQASSSLDFVTAFLAATCLATLDTCDQCDNDCDGLTDEDCLSLDFAEDPIADVVAVGSEGGWHCTGVLVSPQHVLTARHCLPASRVLFGPDIDSPEKILGVKRDLPHPASRLDAALLELKERTDVNFRRRRARGDTQPPFGVVRHAGFGARDPDGNAGFGRKHFMDVWAHGWNCDAAQSQRLGCDPAFEFVLPAGSGRDTCAGDSGGPVLERLDKAPMCPTAIIESSRPIYRLLGITSRPVASARQRCGDGGVYVRMDQIAAWLDSLLPPPSPEKR